MRDYTLSNYYLSDTICQNSLILVNDRRKNKRLTAECDDDRWILHRFMFRVKTLPSGENPSFSSIWVEEVLPNILEPKEGFWYLDGPNAYYIDYGCEEGPMNPDSDAECFERGHGINNYLQTILNSFGNPTRIIVNPHGRDVLKYYWWGSCPECDGHGSFCPRCSGNRWPDLLGSSCSDQSCYVCMGYDFALADKIDIMELDRLKRILCSEIGKMKEGRSRYTVTELREMKEDVILGERERYEAINRRRKEMELIQEDVEEILEDTDMWLWIDPDLKDSEDIDVSDLGKSGNETDDSTITI
ncbi:hypothetical protein N7495_007230 [Penicillium taxi]|uniref:uncharacterized protein n=1 Tax=Penicillium taxi TaxID=168475 RepID=UPI0025454A72|nr:uncharacterized protein N7495_007230 [Penicillium taxi]KAJ5895539.1 hypothetical protein N7495_007230 [Penicillium taxi]